jgi:lia operon protein LiaH
MSSLFERIKNSIAADLHELLDQKEQKNPIASLNHHLRQCEQEVEKVRKFVERHYLLKDEFTREYNHARALAEKRKRQAEIALKAGETELYDFVVQEQAQYEERAARLQESLFKVEQQLRDLEQKYEEMKHKLKDLYIKRMELMGRENIARAFHRMNRMLESSALTSPISRFAELESYIDRLEHQVNSNYYRNTIDSRIAHLEKKLKMEESQLNS